MPETATLEEIYAPIDDRLRQVPASILELLTSRNELAEEVIRYFFSRGGKLLRPALTLLGGELLGAKLGLEKKLLHLAAAFEIFHAATLIHDDIVDSAFLRRNIPTINVKWGPQVAVLVGDYLHDKAIGAVLANGGSDILSLFLRTAGAVCDGEIHELKVKGDFGLSEEEYFEIVDKKTAVLLACCIESGAMLTGATQAQAQALGRFGRYFGMAFQVIDDCLDFTGEEQEFGKTLGADVAAGVLTLPLIRLLQVADAGRKKEILEIFRSQKVAEKFQTLLALIREHGALDYALERARGYCDKARWELSIFPDSPGRRSLERLVDYVLERDR